MTHEKWLLPDGIEELLPDSAERVERHRRKLIELYGTWGYRMVIPPLVEFLDSLLTGVGRDLDLQTFKVTDQISGRLLGVRADLTPQVARMDARNHVEGQVNRFCYIGSVLRTRARNALTSRSPLQAGCELFGVSGIDGDIEVISLMVETLLACEIRQIHLDLSHVGIARRLLELSDLSESDQAALWSAWQRRSQPDVDRCTAAIQDSRVKKQIRALPEAIVSLDEFETLRAAYSGDPVLDAALDQVEALGRVVAGRFPEVDFCVDLCEMRGYHYHTGLFFSAFSPDHGQALAEGGRYDGVGTAFGAARPATGFSIDLRSLCRSGSLPESPGTSPIHVQRSDDPRQWSAVRDLRGQGEIVIFEMPDSMGGSTDTRITRQLVKAEDGGWVVRHSEDGSVREGE